MNLSADLDSLQLTIRCAHDESNELHNVSSLIAIMFIFVYHSFIQLQCAFLCLVLHSHNLLRLVANSLLILSKLGILESEDR